MAMSSSPSATVAVEKATSDLLINPDWTMNIDICDSVNSHHWQAKDVVKAVKKRLLHKSPRVQLLALTLLETMVKNCGDYVHLQIVEKNILGEMVKIVKKKTDMHVRDKILVLLDSWQEAFGGPGGKHPQYYWAYEELRRSGVQFPLRSLDTAPIFTPPVTRPPLQPAQAGYGMPSNSTRRLDETMATEIEGLSLSILDSMRNIMELLSDMMRAVNPSDQEAVKDEVIVDLVNRCRSDQKKLMQMLTTTGDEDLLARGLELNDNLQIVLARHDALATGSPMPTEVTTLNPKPTGGMSNGKPAEGGETSPTPYTNTTVPVANVTRAQIDEEDEKEDDFAMLARRHSKTQPSPSQSTYGTNGGLVLADPGHMTSTTTNLPNAAPCNALALPDPPAPVRITKEQDMIDFLSITLSSTSTSDNPSNHSTPPASSQNMPQIPVSSATQGYSSCSQGYSGNQGQVSYNSYIVPWAQPPPQQQLQTSSQSQQQLQTSSQSQQQLQTSSQSQQQFQTQSQPQSQPQPQQQLHHQSQPELQAQLQLQMQSQYPQYTSGYPPPPWAAALGYPGSQNHIGAINNTFSIPRASTTASYTPMQVTRPLQHHNSFPARGSNGSAINGDPWISSGSRNAAPPGGQKPFVPSYRLFEDLNVLGSADGRFKMTSGTSQSLSGTSGQGMVGGRK